MTVDCQYCYENISENEDLIEYDQAPFHESCMKDKFREDNPNLSEGKYEEFDKKAELADKFRKDGNLLVPIIFERNKNEEGEASK